MVNGIDASTGIPLDDSSMIQQIPLGGQVFPFADWDASARPTRNPIYGDDILPTSALVAGQMPTQDAAQSVHTDGNHALLVSDVNKGGAGLTQGEMFNVTIGIPQYSESIVFGPGTHRMIRVSGGTRLYAIHGEIYMLVQGSSNPLVAPANMQLLAMDVTETFTLLCLDAFILGPMDSTQEQRRYRFDGVYPGGIDLSSQIAPNVDWAIDIVLSDDTQVWWTITAFVGPS